MSRFRLSRSAALTVLGLLVLATRSATAASCRQDVMCMRAFAQAEAANTKKQRLAALLGLQEAYRRLSDPRLLVSIGKLQHAVGQDEQAIASCQQAQATAPADAELQAQAQKCLARASSALPPSDLPRAQSVPIGRAQTSSGPASATVHNNIINVNPQITASPHVQVMPQFIVAVPQLPAQSLEHVPIYRKWWLWTAVGLVAIAVGIGISQAASEPDTTGYPTYHLSTALAF